jgi:hypothetical protein
LGDFRVTLRELLGLAGRQQKRFSRIYALLRSYFGCFIFLLAWFKSTRRDHFFLEILFAIFASSPALTVRRTARWSAKRHHHQLSHH